MLTVLFGVSAFGAGQAGQAQEAKGLIARTTCYWEAAFVDKASAWRWVDTGMVTLPQCVPYWCPEVIMVASLTGS